MTWCEANGIDFALGLARNERLVAMVNYHLGMAHCAYATSIQSERMYCKLEYQTLDTRSRSQRVVSSPGFSRIACVLIANGWMKPA
jgi:hypothetical protein